MIAAFEQANNIEISYSLVGRRAGDIAVCYSDPSLAKKELGWTAQRDLQKNDERYLELAEKIILVVMMDNDFN